MRKRSTVFEPPATRNQRLKREYFGIPRSTVYDIVLKLVCTRRDEDLDTLFRNRPTLPTPPSDGRVERTVTYREGRLIGRQSDSYARETSVFGQVGHQSSDLEDSGTCKAGDERDFGQ